VTKAATILALKAEIELLRRELQALLRERQGWSETATYLRLRNEELEAGARNNASKLKTLQRENRKLKALARRKPKKGAGH
jgi:hypothetical protein